MPIIILIYYLFIVIYLTNVSAKFTLHNAAWWNSEKLGRYERKCCGPICGATRGICLEWLLKTTTVLNRTARVRTKTLLNAEYENKIITHNLKVHSTVLWQRLQTFSFECVNSLMADPRFSRPSLPVESAICNLQQLWREVKLVKLTNPQFVCWVRTPNNWHLLTSRSEGLMHDKPSRSLRTNGRHYRDLTHETCRKFHTSGDEISHFTLSSNRDTKL